MRLPIFFHQPLALGVILCSLPLAIRAALPPVAEIRADLDNIYATSAAQPAAAHRGPVMRALEPLLVQQGRALAAQLKPWPGDPAAALLPLEKGTASSEHGIRPNAATAKGLALLVRLLPDEAFPADFTRAQARAAALSLLRYLVHTHGASGGTCADGKPWRNQWQSAYWAAMAGEACWLLWDDLNPTERWLAARMICDEADRFVEVVPPANLVNDSKAEENAWNSEVISLAFNFFPGHSRNSTWRDAAIRWIASSFCTAGDVRSEAVVDKRPLREWLTAPNLHEDFTLENHSRVHPDYMACTYLLTSQVPMYAWGGNRAPTAINLNVEAINAVVKRLATPEGSVIYPNGQDWGLHRNVDWLEYHGTMAVLYGDRQSATFLRHSLDAVTRMAARNPAGLIYAPGETRLSSDQHMTLEYMAHTYALMAQLGEGPAPLPDEQVWRELAGSRVFGAGRFGLARTPDSIATFSWGAQVMGQVLPLRKDLLLSPEGRGLVGYPVIEGLEREAPVVRRAAVAPLAEGFGVTGVLERGAGAIEQRFGFLALPDGRVVYVDSLAATGSVRIKELNLGTMGVLNDANWPFHDGKRTVFHAGGERTFFAAQAKTDPPVTFASPWLNLDNQLGIVRLAAAGPAVYNPAPTGAAGRLEQRFHLSTAAGAATSAGAPLAFDAYVFYPNRDAAQTRAIAAKCALLSAPGANPLRLRLDDGMEVTFDLAAGGLQIVPPAPPVPAAGAVQTLAERVADHYLAMPRPHHPDSWMRASFYMGVLALDVPRLDDAIRGIAAPLDWKLRRRVYHADDHAMGQVYVELFHRRPEPAVIAPLQARFDYILAHRKTGSVDRAENPAEPHSVWSWCDALFMAPPAWVGLARATGNSAYLDFAVTEWERTSAFLYDPKAHLFYRDNGFLARREPNGEKIFWGRGNGWVVAGLARVLEQLPAGHPARPRFEQQLREMAAALVALQQPDGLWRSSLLDPASYPVAETSGSGFFCYGLAWGINHGVLDRATYLPATLRAWQGLVGCVTPEGKVTHVQQVGAAPVNFDPALTEDYGVGAFLLAASEVRRLGGKRPVASEAPLAATPAPGIP